MAFGLAFRPNIDTYYRKSIALNLLQFLVICAWYFHRFVRAFTCIRSRNIFACAQIVEMISFPKVRLNVN
jgi:endonuclease/exonuclease/phosphatase (EEP) superfamily protein YafD